MGSHRPVNTLYPCVPAAHPLIPPGLFHMLVARSGCEYCTPLSRIATTTELVPVDTFHARSDLSSAPGVPVTPFTRCPVFWTAHCKATEPSFGSAPPALAGAAEGKATPAEL